MLQNIEKILSERKQRIDEQGEHFGASKREWLQRVDSLLATIRSWLRPLEEKKYATVSYSTVSIFEELLGTYDASTMKVSFFGGEKNGTAKALRTLRKTCNSAMHPKPKAFPFPD